MKKLLINTTFNGMINGTALGSKNLINFALILEIEDNFCGDLKPLIHEKLIELNQEILPSDYKWYILNFTAQSFT